VSAAEVAVKPARPTRRSITRVLEEVRGERYAQDEKWGEQNHPDGTGRPDDAWVADAVRERCEAAFAEGRGTWRDVLTEEFQEALAETDADKLRAELIQVAAVCVAWVEAIDRRADS
jgi:hypothetical protein